jgi:2-C-methyl-D-erythritol 4-phosphate cytidylyltransferase
MTRAVRRWAVVLAAGRGERFGARTPKQYQPLLGRVVLDWALAPFITEKLIDGIVVALAPRDRRWSRSHYSSHRRVEVATGAERRELSLANALRTLEGRAADRDWVVVHDAARPCLRPEDLRRLLRATATNPVGGLLAVPLSDTLKRSDARGRSTTTLSREGLWRAVTPQAFRYGILQRALWLCLERGQTVSDEAAAIERLGLRPQLVASGAHNVKITHREDLALATAILRARRRTR